MGKNKLLKTLGFSDQFLKEIDDYNCEGMGKINVPVLSNDFFRFTVNDTSDLYIEKALRRDSSSFVTQK